MPHTIAICTHKGGTGKTVTTLALAAGFAMQRKRTLLIDLDPQAHSTIGLAVEPDGVTLKDFFEQHPALPLRKILRSAGTSGYLQVAPADPRLAWTAEILSGRPKKEELLKRSLREIVVDFDRIVIDTPPSLGVMAQNAVVAADFIVIPTLAEARAGNAIQDFLELVRLLKGDSFESYRILLTQVDGRKTRTNSAVAEALNPWSERICRSYIPLSEPLNQAQMIHQDIYTFAPDCTGAKAYQELLEELSSL